LPYSATGAAPTQHNAGDARVHLGQSGTGSSLDSAQVPHVRIPDDVLEISDPRRRYWFPVALAHAPLWHGVTRMASLSLDDLRHQIDLLPPERPVVIERSADVMGGLTVFRGTRVPAGSPRLPRCRRRSHHVHRRFPDGQAPPGDCPSGARPRAHPEVIGRRQRPLSCSVNVPRMLITEVRPHERWGQGLPHASSRCIRMQQECCAGLTPQPSPAAGR
jgi:hypothetical protein